MNYDHDTLLLVDDEPTNLDILQHYLEKLNYTIVRAATGKEALAQVKKSKPNLILLDIMMPEMDGFETCKALKANEDTCDIPVIFMTALSNLEDKIKGLKVGAVDYITKPIEYKEVSARLNVHLTLQKMQGVLQQQKIAIEQKNIELQNKNRELDAFTQFVVNDLKNPLLRQAGFTKVLMKSNLLDNNLLTFLQEIEEARHQMVELVDNMGLLAKTHNQDLMMEPLDMEKIMVTVQHRFSTMIDKYQAEITFQETWPTVLGYTPWIEKILETYISNGLKYGGTPPTLELGATLQDDNMVQFWVRDNGLGLRTEQRKQLFSPLLDISKAKFTQEGYGLKLSIVRLLIEKCGGHVAVSSEVGRGSTFSFTLQSK
ncbi:MAG: response regulator [Thiomargarita sp.]|nr:response regulator [Thiomargarita sp.]